VGQHCCKAHTLSIESSPYAANWTTTVTRRALSGAHIPPTKVFRRLSEYNNFKTTCRCSGGPRQYAYVGFSRRKIPRPSAYTISEKAIRFRHPGHNPDRAQKLTSSSMSRHLSTGNISSKSIHAFLSSLANRQTDRQTRAKTFISSFIGGNNTCMHWNIHWAVNHHIARVGQFHRSEDLCSSYVRQAVCHIQPTSRVVWQCLQLHIYILEFLIKKSSNYINLSACTGSSNDEHWPGASRVTGLDVLEDWMTWQWYTGFNCTRHSLNRPVSSR